MNFEKVSLCNITSSYIPNALFHWGRQRQHYPTYEGMWNMNFTYILCFNMHQSLHIHSSIAGTFRVMVIFPWSFFKDAIKYRLVNEIVSISPNESPKYPLQHACIILMQPICSCCVDFKHSCIYSQSQMIIKNKRCLYLVYRLNFIK